MKARNLASENRRTLIELAAVDDDAHDDEPRPRGALLLILIYLVILAAFWINTYLRIWRS